jgi:hypothetical protein
MAYLGGFTPLKDDVYQFGLGVFLLVSVVLLNINLRGRISLKNDDNKRVLADNASQLSREIEGGFRVSDPVLEHPVDCLTDDLERARFAHGPLEPHGFMYYPALVPKNPDIKKACIKGMKDTCNMMLRIPIPIFGIRGMRFLAKRIIASPQKLGFDEACRHLANIVRMQEEIGTGGAGFRFMYAAFLQEAGELFGSDDLARLSQEMTAIGDVWREFAVVSARIVKQRGKSEDNFDKAGGLMLICADREEALFRELHLIVRKLKA